MNSAPTRVSRDADLIRRAKRGDLEAFGSLYEQYLDVIFRYIRTRVPTEADAEDLTEMVFIRSFEAIEAYEDRGYPYSAFLYRVARNVIADHYRQRTEEPLESYHEDGKLSPSLEEELIQREGYGELEDAMLELSPDYREVIRLRVLLELPVPTIAEWMDRSEGAVRIMLHRALKALRVKVLEKVDV